MSLKTMRGAFTATGRWTQQDLLNGPVHPAHAYAYECCDLINATDGARRRYGRCVAKSAIDEAIGGAAAGFVGGLHSAVLDSVVPIIIWRPATLTGSDRRDWCDHRGDDQL